MKSSFIPRRLAAFCGFLFFIMVIVQSGWAADPREVTDREMKAMRQQIEKEAQMLRRELEKEEYDSDFAKEVSIGYQLDAFRIDQLLKQRINIDYSTSGMVTATYEAESEYDDLLNKYYQKLQAKLSGADKAVLKQSQKNWLQFRDSERELNTLLTKDEYSGGGTIQRTIGSDCDLELTKARVKGLVEYLLRFAE
jgi:uncharacterized protein YecT (DUF1311 family)